MPKKDKYSYKGWLISDSFCKRALAHYGYNFVGGLLVLLGFLATVVVIWLIFFLVGKLVDAVLPLF